MNLSNITVRNVRTMNLDYTMMQYASQLKDFVYTHIVAILVLVTLGFLLHIGRSYIAKWTRTDPKIVNRIIDNTLVIFLIVSGALCLDLLFFQTEVSHTFLN